jgi:hypothetical protein
MVASTEYRKVYHILHIISNSRFIRHPINIHNLLLIIYFGITKTVCLLSLVLPNYSGTVARAETSQIESYTIFYKFYQIVG